MVSGLIGNEVPRKGLRVRAPCPPLEPALLERVFFVSCFLSQAAFLTAARSLRIKIYPNFLFCLF